MMNVLVLALGQNLVLAFMLCKIEVLGARFLKALEHLPSTES
jgi:hypothetical protein